MKNILILCLVLVGLQAMAQQEVHARLGEAKASYSAGEIEEARYALQQSIAELDVLICKEIIAILPTEISGLSYIAEDDYVAGNALGLVGSSVQRNYGGEEKSMNLNLMNNSPMMSMVTAFLTNPMFANAADGSQKQLKISGQKAVLQKNTEVEGDFTIQIPLNDSLLSLEFTNFNEQDAIAAAESINITGILEILN